MESRMVALIDREKTKCDGYIMLVLFRKARFHDRKRKQAK